MTHEMINHTQAILAHIQQVKDTEKNRLSSCVINHKPLRDGVDELIRKIQEIADEHVNSEALLAFIGEMSGGKSMIINVLVQQPLLPSARVATSESPVELRYGNKPLLEVVTLDKNGKDKQVYYYGDYNAISMDIKRRLLEYALSLGEQGIISSENLEYYYQVEGQKTENLIDQVSDIYRVIQLMLIVLSASVGRGRPQLEVDPQYAKAIQMQKNLLKSIFGVNENQSYAVRVKLPAAILKNGLVLVDLPGLGSGNPLHESITRSYMERADSYVLPFTPVLRTEECASALAEIVKYEKMSMTGKDSRFIVVLNQCDMIRKKIDFQVAIKQIHPMLAQIQIPMIYPISAYYGEHRMVENGFHASVTRWGRNYIEDQLEDRDEDEIAETEVAQKLRTRYEKPFEYEDLTTKQQISSSTKDFMDGVIGGYAPRIRFLNALEQVSKLMRSYSSYAKDLRARMEMVYMLYRCGDDLMKQMMEIIDEALKNCSDRFVTQMQNIEESLQKRHDTLRGDVKKALEAYEKGFYQADEKMRAHLDLECNRFLKDAAGHVLIDEDAYTRLNVVHNLPIYNALIQFFRDFDFSPYTKEGETKLQNSLEAEKRLYRDGLSEIKKAFIQFSGDVTQALGDAYDHFVEDNRSRLSPEMEEIYGLCYQMSCEAVTDYLTMIGVDVIKFVQEDKCFEAEMTTTTVRMSAAISRVKDYYHKYCVEYMQGAVKISSFMRRAYVDIDTIKREVGKHFRTKTQNHNDLALMDKILCDGVDSHVERIESVVMKLNADSNTLLVKKLSSYFPRLKTEVESYFGEAKGEIGIFFSTSARIMKLICEDTKQLEDDEPMTEAITFGKNEEFSRSMTEEIEAQIKQMRKEIADNLAKAKAYQKECEMRTEG